MNVPSLSLKRNVSRTALYFALALVTSLGLSACHFRNPPATRVESGLRYTSGQAEFDAFFNEFFQRQTELYRAPDEERTMRREFSRKFEVKAGTTAQALADAIAERAKKLEVEKTLLKLKVEGYDADDETDTMVQSAVTETLDDSTKAFVENATLLARLELRHAAKLRKLNKQLRRLVIQAQALEPSIEPTFTGQGYAKVDEVRRNFQAVKRTLPTMSLQAAEQADTSTEFVRKLAQVMTTDRSATSAAEPPLIAPLQTKKTKPTGVRRRNGGGSAPKPKPEASPSGGGDFEP